jgi:hypothetical protein
MPPQNPYNQPTPDVRPIPRAPAEPLQNTPYDFIMNPSVKPPKRGLGLPGGTKLVYIAGSGVLLVIIVFAVLSLTSGGSNSPALTSIAQQQAELTRVAELHYSDIHDTATKNFVISTQLSLASAQTEYLQYLSSNGAGIGEKQIALGMNAQTDAALDAAQTSGTLDSTVRTTLQTGIERYQVTLQSAYNASGNPKTKALLKDLFEQAALLLEQSKV